MKVSGKLSCAPAKSLLERRQGGRNVEAVLGPVGEKRYGR